MSDVFDSHGRVIRVGDFVSTNDGEGPYVAREVRDDDVRVQGRDVHAWLPAAFLRGTGYREALGS